MRLLFFFNHPPPPEIYTLSLHDALPISQAISSGQQALQPLSRQGTGQRCLGQRRYQEAADRKSTRLNSSHLGISYAVFCLKKKKIKTPQPRPHAGTTKN